MSSSASVPTPRRTVRSIQILRAVASLGVVYYHAVDAGGNFALPSTGAWGVDVFFVISGFIIGTVTVRGSIAYFFRRRVFRVVPLYWIATLGWAAAVLLMPWRANSTQVDLPGLVKSLLFIPYQMPLRDGPILQLGWTLEYEMFFYLVVGLLLWTLGSARRALPAAIVLLTAFVVSGLLWPSQNFLLSFFQNTLLLEFLAGMLIALIFERVSRRGRRDAADLVGDPVASRGSAAHVALYVIAGIALLGSFLAMILQDLGVLAYFGSMRAQYYGIPAVILVTAALVLEPLIRDSRLTRALIVIGDSSYAMYLFHPFVTVFLSQVVLGGIIAAAGAPVRVVLLICTLAVVTLVSIGIDRWLDAPIQRGLKRAFLPSRSKDTLQVR